MLIIIFINHLLVYKLQWLSNRQMDVVFRRIYHRYNKRLYKHFRLCLFGDHCKYMEMACSTNEYSLGPILFFSRIVIVALVFFQIHYAHAVTGEKKKKKCIIIWYVYGSVFLWKKFKWYPHGIGVGINDVYTIIIRGKRKK